MLKSIIDYAEGLEAEGNPNGKELLDLMNQYLVNKIIAEEIPDQVFWKTVERQKGSWSGKHLKPGDQIWFKNTFFNSGSSQGEEGSNRFWGDEVVLKLDGQKTTCDGTRRDMARWLTSKRDREIRKTLLNMQSIPEGFFPIQRIRRVLTPEEIIRSLKKELRID
jgi:hypothetical protein